MNKPSEKRNLLEYIEQDLIPAIEHIEEACRRLGCEMEYECLMDAVKDAQDAILDA